VTGETKCATVAEGALAEAQKGLLGLLLAGGEQAARVREELSPEDFDEGVLRALAERLLSGDAVEVGAILSVSSPEEAAVLTAMTVEPIDEDNGSQACDDYIGAMRRARIQAEIEAVEREIETAELTGDDEKLLSRMAARQKLALRLRELAAGS
jgi:hypothetical protein